MHNGCLLLLAFVAVFQPIASYTERGLIDGKQRCDYRTSVRDPGLNFHGTYRFAKPAVEDRRLNHREDIRDVRRNEVREDSLRTASSSDRRLADILERDRNTLKEPSRDRIGNDADLRREVREARLSSYRDERKQEIRRDRVARVQETRQARTPSRREHSRSEYENNYQRTDDRLSNEHPVKSQRDTRSNEAQRVGEHREIRSATNRVRDDVTNRLDERRFSREGVQRIDMQRSASRIQLDGNTDREILGRRSRDEQLRSSSTSRSRRNRAYNSKATRDETTSLDRDDRRISSFQRSVDERRQMRDISRIRLTAERKNNLETTISRMNLRDIHDRASENRREARLSERVQATESPKENRDTEGKVRLIRTVRAVDDRFIQDDICDSRMFARERPAETRREVRDAPSMERFRSLERSIEYRKDSRSDSDENRRVIRNMETRRDNRNTERDSSEIRCEIQNSNRDTCAHGRTKSTEQRMTRLARERSQENRRVARTVESRAIRTDRVDESRRVARNSDVRSSSDENRREIRNIETRRATRNSERDSSKVRGAIRNSNRDTGAYDREQSTEHRMTRLAKERSQENRRVARTSESRAISTDRVDESRRVARNNDLRSFNTERAEQSRRVTRNYAESRVFRTERTDQSRRDNRNLGSRAFRTESTEQMRRDARNVDSRLFRTERADETQRASRTVGVREFRTERTEDTRSNNILVFRTERAIGNRRNAQDFERQSRSLERDIDYRRDSRNVGDTRLYERALERNIRSTELRTENEQVANSRRAARSSERESRTIGRERTTAVRDFRTVRERRSVDRRERAIENRKKVQSTPEELRTTQKGIRVESRGINLVRARDDLAQRNSDRAIERLSKRDSLEERYSSTLQRELRRDTQRTSERDNLAARLRETGARNWYNADFARKREFQAMFKNPTHAENEAPTRNWQYIFYTVQALYIGGLLMQLNKRSVDKKTRVSWWSHQQLTKVE